MLFLWISWLDREPLFSLKSAACTSNGVFGHNELNNRTFLPEKTPNS
jgi:hypothetical protein